MIGAAMLQPVWHTVNLLPSIGKQWNCPSGLLVNWIVVERRGSEANQPTITVSANV